MLAVVKTPPTEIALSGAGAEEVLALLRRHFDIQVFNRTNGDDEPVELRETTFGKKYRKRLLAGYRLKAEITQEQLAEATGISQNVISEYETGKRRITAKAANRLAKVLGIEPERLLPEDN